MMEITIKEWKIQVTPERGQNWKIEPSFQISLGSLAAWFLFKPELLCDDAAGSVPSSWNNINISTRQQKYTSQVVRRPEIGCSSPRVMDGKEKKRMEDDLPAEEVEDLFLSSY